MVASNPAAPELERLSDECAEMANEGLLVPAERGLRDLIGRAPNFAPARANLALILLAQGRYTEAAPYYESRHMVRRGARPKPSFSFPEWRGEDLRGKSLMIFPEQGLGDEIMFARFAADLGNRGADVTLICAPQLFRLFERNLPARVLAAAGEVSFADPDYWTMMNSLLTLSGVPPESLPSTPYLGAQPVRSGGIGIRTIGSPTHGNDANRSLPKHLAEELLGLPSAIDLDPATTGASDFQDTAEIVAGLDLIISVDTSVAHLAGAMGKPVWILLPSVGTDWRWMHDRHDSPWYPTARLFRQGRDRDWRPVISQIKETLRRMAI